MPFWDYCHNLQHLVIIFGVSSFWGNTRLLICIGTSVSSSYTFILYLQQHTVPKECCNMCAKGLILFFVCIQRFYWLASLRHCFSQRSSLKSLYEFYIPALGFEAPSSALNVCDRKKRSVCSRVHSLTSIQAHLSRFLEVRIVSSFFKRFLTFKASRASLLL